MEKKAHAAMSARRASTLWLKVISECEGRSLLWNHDQFSGSPAPSMGVIGKEYAVHGSGMAGGPPVPDGGPRAVRMRCARAVPDGSVRCCPSGEIGRHKGLERNPVQSSIASTERWSDEPDTRSIAI